MTILKSVCRICLLGVLSAMSLAGAGAASPVGSTFTYQGALEESGTAAAGDYDMRFALYDASSGGAQVATTLTLSSVTVDDGLFEVSLDFGPGAFDAEARWLAIQVAPSGGAYTALEPRQLVSPAPQALYAAHATTATVFTGSVAESQIPAEIARDSEVGLPLYEAIVAPSGGDYTAIETALSAGFDSVYVRNGTYVPGGNLVVSTDGLALKGESREKTVIDLRGSLWEIMVYEDTSYYDTGLVAVNNNSTSVAGAGTYWLSWPHKTHILLGEAWYEIASVGANDSLTLAIPYRGRSLFNHDYRLADMATDITIENFTILTDNPLTTPIRIQQALNVTFRNCTFNQDGEYSPLVTDSSGVAFENCLFENGQYNLYVVDSYDCSMRDCKSVGGKVFGLYINRCNRFTVANSEFTGCDGSAVRMQDSEHCIVEGNTMRNCNDAGVSAVIRSNYNTIAHNTMGPGIHYGVYLSSSHCNTVSGNQVAGTSLHAYYVSNSSSCTLTSNVARECNGSGVQVNEGSAVAVSGNAMTDCSDGLFLIDATYCTVVGNSSTGNNSYGIEIRGGCIDNIVGMNVLFNNASGPGRDLGTNTMQKATNYPSGW